MDRVNNRPRGRQNEQNRLISLLFIEVGAEVTEIFPVMTEVITKAEKISSRGLMVGS